MNEIIDFDECEVILGLTYLGNAGRKFAVKYHNEPWMIKFPESTKNFKGKHLPSYTSSPISEYIGSKVYEILGIPVHQVVLGKREGKIVAGCKDFVENNKLMEFRGIKNTISEESLIDGNGSSEKGDKLSDVLKVISEATIFQRVEGSVLERFWDMFVVDTFILNNDRNNGNWGLLVKPWSFELAPVYDNGNALYNKRNASVAERRLQEIGAIDQDALQASRSFFTDDEGNHIHPCTFIEEMQNADCNAAVLRFVDKVDMQKIYSMIDDIPETAFDLEVITPVQKQLYKEVLNTVYSKCLLPTAHKLRESV